MVARPYIGITFTCCRVYVRVYLNRDKTAYVGHCPKCGGRCTIDSRVPPKEGNFWHAG